ncbi:Pimeloyl-ACP methyl ester carboxylesterase [Geodermatophilus africanus]|uniref:Pimeloyl-ACP methyl ester carboxylesterase n=1 Tax=Geodermatophilus africanus TaxID=1137993 RepID=A0A1H3EBA9_9ACTN|nr:alpha/beta hydrolase [Geodermatophilus africanus]SDX76042.1 Pimeloyl-ACP methyl ester carboxylesterase [Geodermatophilus africanus]
MAHYVLVHGAWGGGWVWDDVARRLEGLGHRVTVVDQLPSARTDPGALGDLRSDAARVRQVLAGIDEPVVLVGNSYGGMVITELADDPRVRHSVYVAAFWPQRGQSLLDLAGGDSLPAWVEPRDDGSLAVSRDPETVREALCADLSREQAAAFRDRLVLQSVAAFTTPSTAPERRHPTTYVVCTQESDSSIPVPAQEAMATPAERLVRLSSAHMAPLSVPDELARALADVAELTGVRA